MLPGYPGLRIQRDPLHMVIRKGDTMLLVDQLSDGEKLLVASLTERDPEILRLRGLLDVGERLDAPDFQGE